MSKHQVIVIGPESRRRGRPKSNEPGSTVSAWIPARCHDRLIRIANEQDISVSALVNQVLTKVLKPGSETP